MREPRRLFSNTVYHIRVALCGHRNVYVPTAYALPENDASESFEVEHLGNRKTSELTRKLE